jgi:hypothetical protein
MFISHGERNRHKQGGGPKENDVRNMIVAYLTEAHAETSILRSLHSTFLPNNSISQRKLFKFPSVATILFHHLIQAQEKFLYQVAQK